MGSWRDAFDEPPPPIVWAACWGVVIVLVAFGLLTGIGNSLNVTLGHPSERTWWTYHGDETLYMLAAAIVVGLVVWRHRARRLTANVDRS